MQARGIQPIMDPEQMAATFWPVNDDIDDFITAVRELRRQGG